MSRLMLSTLAAVSLAAPIAAHHETPGKSHAVATVTISEAVKADGKPLAPGTYEVWILDDRPDLGAGAPSNAQRVVELYQNGKMMAREVAEVFPAGERPVGTSARASGFTKWTPSAWRSWRNASPRPSAATLPMYAARPPNDATPHMVLAAEPPDISIGAASDACRPSARSVSISVIAPLTSS